MTEWTGRQERQEEFFKQRREQLRNWPYTIHQIDDTLDISLIEGRGKQLLFRAIQTRGLTAFAGTGLSISYGRLGWRDWEKEQQRIARANAKAFLALNQAALRLMAELHDLVQPKNEFSDNAKKLRFVGGSDFERLWSEINEDGPGSLARNGPSDEVFHKAGLTLDDRKWCWGQPQRHNVWRWLRSRQSAHDFAGRQINGLNETFRKTQEQEGQFPGGEEMPVKFEVAQQLHSELHRHVSLFLPPLEEINSKAPLKENLDSWKEKAWHGSLATTENGAPKRALLALRWFLERPRKKTPELVTLIKGYDKAFKDFSKRMSRPEAKLSFATLAKVLLIDECPHALLYLREGVFRGQDPDNEGCDQKQFKKWLEVEDGLEIFNTVTLKRNPDGIRKNPNRYKVLTPYKLENFKALLEKALKRREDWVLLDQLILTALDNYKSRLKGRVYLSPSARFMLAAYLAREANPTGWLQKNGMLGAPHRTDFMNRASIIDSNQDPLRKVVTDLGIRNYVTTNYDFEIERFFEDSGYRKFPENGEDHNARDAKPSPDEFRTDDIGGVLKDQCFSQDTAADLVTFAVNQKSHDASVYHLHGRATKEDKLVITERDYMELYLSSGPKRATADEGISLVFSGLPLIFLGLGMNETDLLRPLRQFISNRDRTIGYTSIALLPADDGIAARTKFSSALYLRYGVHTIFYGSGTVSVQRLTQTGWMPKDSPSKPERGLDWMHRMLKLIWAMQNVTEQWITNAGPPAHLGTIEKIYKYVEEQVGFVEDDLADPQLDYAADEAALDTLLGLQRGLNKFKKATPDETKEQRNQRHSKEKTANDAAWRRVVCRRLLDKEPSRSSVRLAHCRFTPTRPRNSPSPHKDDEPAVSSEEFLSDEVEMVTEFLVMTLELGRKDPASIDGDFIDRDLRARLIFLKGLDGALRTGCMNASIAAIVKEQRQWWHRFQQSPPHRVAKFQFLEHVSHETSTSEATFEPRRYVRHNVDSVITNTEKLDVNCDLSDKLIRNPRFPGRINKHVATGIRTFDTFIAAIDANFSDKEFSHDRRALITVAALRGIGKGTFMSAFSSRRGLKLYSEAAWGKISGVRISGAIFINLSFSTEIGSVFDMLIKAINAEVLHLNPDDDSGGEFEARVTAIAESEVGVSRMRRLEAAINRYKEKSDEAAQKRDGDLGSRCRLLIQIGSVDLLFDGQGRTKNLEIEQFLKILLGEKSKYAPIDIVFSGSELGLGEPWTISKMAAKRADLPRRRRMDRANLPLDAEEHIDRRLRESGIEIDDAPSGNDCETATHFIHFARPVSATTFLIDNFPTLAMALFLANPPEKIDSKAEGLDEKKIQQSYKDALKKARKLFSDNLQTALRTSDDVLDKLWQRERLPSKKELRQVRDIVRHMPVGVPTEFMIDVDEDATSEEIEKAESFKVLMSEYNEKLAQLSRQNLYLIKAIADVGNLSKLAKDNEGNYNKERFRSDGFEVAWRDPLNARVRSQPHRDNWQEVRKRLADSRFSMTILIAMAERIVVHAPDPVEGGKKAANFIISTVERGRNFGRARRDEFLLETVLLGYREFHKEGIPDLDCDLHQLILRHLGAIGTPLSAAVLVRLPDFRAYFSRIGIELEYSRRRFLVRALTTLSYRGLVFRLDPHPRLVELARRGEVASGNNGRVRWEAQLEFRYALHRVVQSFAVSKLNLGANDPIRTNSFAPTLYSSMPSAGPRLSAEPYRFLRSLLLGLSQYPDISNRETSMTPWLFTTQDRSVRVQALRAALCLVRSNLSVAVVSRLHEEDFVSLGLQKRGYLETYKVRLRWIIRLAWELLETRDKRHDMKPDDEFNGINALYRDEIVWIYNELGVVSLAQGALSDGLGFLRQAAEFNEHIEGRSRAGPNYFSISLNHAIVQLERGRLVSARTRLEKIRDATKERKCALHYSAVGYLCVLDHLTGRHEGLGGRFESVSGKLQDLPATRASALILTHRARFLIDKDRKVAGESIDRATVLAETGGHEDVRHICNLVGTRFSSANEDGTVPMSQGRALSILREIDAYSARMSIWSLQCESLMHRAALLLEDGETTTAGRLLMRSMAIARRNSMGLRLNRALTLYALVLIHRGDRDGAKRVADASLEMAKSSGYNLETLRAQKVLTEAESRLSFGDSVGGPVGVLF